MSSFRRSISSNPYTEVAVKAHQTAFQMSLDNSPRIELHKTFQQAYQWLGAGQKDRFRMSCLKKTAHLYCMYCIAMQVAWCWHHLWD